MRNAECGVRNGKTISILALFVLLGAVALAAEQSLSQKLAALEKLPSRFSFIVLGDNRAGDPACDAVYEKLISAALKDRPNLVVNTGDEIDKPGSREDWARFRDLSKNVAVPYYLTVGNHDVHPEAEGSEQTYRDEVALPGNELYYAFLAGNSLFIVLDSNLRGEEKKIAGEQLAWLERVLERAMPTNRFVFVHHPLYPEPGRGKHHGNSLDRYKEERDRLQQLFVKYKVTAVFAGHEHLYLRKTVDGVLHIITGGGGAPLYTTEKKGGFHHYVRVTVDGDKVNGEVVDVDGKVRDRF